MTFIDALSAAREAAGAGGTFVCPDATTAEELVALLAFHTDFGMADRLLDAVNVYRATPLWSIDAALQAAIGFTIANQPDHAYQQLAGDVDVSPPCETCLGLADQMLAANCLELAERWLALLARRWPGEWHIDLMRGGLAHGRFAFGEAMGHFEAVLAKDPCNVAVLAPIALIHALCGNRAGGISVLRRLLSIAPESPAQWNARIQAGVELGQWGLALRWIAMAAGEREAIGPFLQEMVARALLEARFFDPFVEALNRVDVPDAARLQALGNCFYAQNRFHEACAAWGRSLQLVPDNPAARFNLGFTQILLGQWQAGWWGYEYRLDPRSGCMTYAVDAPVHRLPVWDGQPTRARLAICSEQGLGDVVQVLRYLPELLGRVGGIEFSFHTPQPTLYSLIGALDDGSAESIEPDEVPDVVPEPVAPAALRVLMMSLPHVLGHPVPDGKPYLSLRTEVRDRALPWVAQAGLRVGLVWAGGRSHLNDHLRSLHFLALLPALSVPGVAFHVLQKGEAVAQVRYAPDGVTLLRTDQHLDDMADLAAAMVQLDLVISVDSMPAHLAGALGVPVWLLLPHTPDFRWGGEGTTTPWYDSMHIFRQPLHGDWRSVADAVAVQLRNLVAARGGQDGVTALDIDLATVAGLPLVPTGRREEDLGRLQTVLAADDRHVGAMMGLARLCLAHEEIDQALFWVGEAIRFACTCVAAWRILRDIMTAAGMAELRYVEDHIAKLEGQGAVEDWFGWR